MRLVCASVRDRETWGVVRSPQSQSRTTQQNQKEALRSAVTVSLVSVRQASGEARAEIIYIIEFDSSRSALV